MRFRERRSPNDHNALHRSQLAIHADARNEFGSRNHQRVRRPADWAAEGAWTIDPSATLALNRAFRDWHADFFSALKAAGIGVTVSFSQELVNPPDNSGGGAVWVQRFPDGSPTETATGFGSLNSSQAAFSSPVQGYMTQVYAAMAALMPAAALTPRLQFGEVLWWFQANAFGMAFYDAHTPTTAQTALGRPLVTFHTPNDDPSVNSYADANFLRARLKSYLDGIRTGVLASYSSAVFELLWPMDANDPAPPDSCATSICPSNGRRAQDPGSTPSLARDSGMGASTTTLTKQTAAQPIPSRNYPGTAPTAAT